MKGLVPLGVIVHDHGTMTIREEDREDINAFLIANGVLPDRVLVSSTIDTRGGRLRLEAIALDDQGKRIFDREGPRMVQLDFQLHVPYIKEARP